MSVVKGTLMRGAVWGYESRFKGMREGCCKNVQGEQFMEMTTLRSVINVR